MKKTFTLIIVFIILSIKVYSQICDGTVPVFTLNFSGNADTTWNSPDVGRAGYCCSATGTDKCIAFDLILNNNVYGVKFEIVSGANPAGALYYQLDCGTPTVVGQFICITGSGTKKLTFCKPGGNSNVFRISTISKPNSTLSANVEYGCSGNLTANNFLTSSITWQSLTNNPTYNAYLSCTSACNVTTVTPAAGYPSYVDYVVSGIPNNACTATTFKDTSRVYFYNILTASISALQTNVCAAQTTTISTQVSGGLAPYSYLWNTGETTSSVIKGAGTYSVTIKDVINCVTLNKSITITSNVISVNAGTDKTVCKNNALFQLGASMTNSAGISWTGGSGSFNPSRIVLNPIYTPTQGEIDAGTLTLYANTTDNGSCATVTDAILISFVNPQTISITGLNTICKINTSEIFNATGSNIASYSWLVNTGVITSGQGTNAVTINWNTLGAQTITLNITDNNGCSNSTTKNVFVDNVNTSVISPQN